MSSINLRKQQVINLKKEVGIGGVKAQVVLALDFSGSMDTLYSNGTVQSTLERILPIGLAFDDNEEVDFYLFHDSFIKVDPNITLSTIGGLAASVKKKYSMGGTNYAPVIDKIIQEYRPITAEVKAGGLRGLFGKTETKVEAAKYPVYVIMITDGANFDKEDTRKAIIEASKLNIFIHFEGVGSDRGEFKFAESLTTLTGKALDNVSFRHIENLNTITDDELYRGIMKKFPEWYKQAVARKICQVQ